MRCAPRAETFKDVQTESDLVAEPGDEVEPARLVDFQVYRDKKFVPKVMLRCALYRLQHPARPMRSHTRMIRRLRPRSRTTGTNLQTSSTIAVRPWHHV